MTPPAPPRILVATTAIASLLAGTALADPGGTDAAQAAGTSVVVTVDAAPAKRHAIDPNIYGLGMGSAPEASVADLDGLNSPLFRLGGNAMSTYSWRRNATNLGADWYFESYPYPGAAPAGEVESFVAATAAAGARAMVTVPILGRVAKLGPGRAVLPSFSIAKYGPQRSHDVWFPDAGDGIRPDGRPIVGNTPADAYVADTPANEQAFVAHLVGRFGTAATTGPAFYLLDNEPSLWFSTHRDVHPVGPHAGEARDRMIAHAAAIRRSDPTARIAGPEEWGWTALLLSGYDQQWGAAHGWSGPFPDRDGVQGGKPYLAWLLGQLKKAGRPIDVFTLHYYPQSNEASDDVSRATQLLRNRSTRELWDPAYVSKSWIADKVRLIPRMKELVAANYHADAAIGLTEYDWGAWNHVNGATAQADLLGIFGREGLDLATHWGVPGADTLVYKAIQLYRNYDGNRNVFGDVGIAAASPRPDDLSAFAALRTADKAMTVMLIDKSLPGTAGAVTQTTLSLAGFVPSGKAMLYRLTAENTIARLPNRFFSGTTLTLATPPQSITLAVLPARGSPVWEPPTARMRLSTTAFRVVPPVAARLVVDASTSTAGTNRIAAYGWDFGDGATAATTKAAHVYRRFGFFPVTLTVTDVGGRIGRVTRTVSVLPARNALTSCTVSYARTGDWGTGFTAALHLTNTGTAALDDWVLEWTFADGQTITGLWGGSLVVQGARQIVTPATWNRSIAPGASIDVGFTADSSGTNSTPTPILLDGSACAAE